MVSTISRSKQQALAHIDTIKSSKSANEKSENRTLYGLREDYNPLFTLSIDLYKDKLYKGRETLAECIHNNNKYMDFIVTNIPTMST